jgi:hypothetical protein
LSRLLSSLAVLAFVASVGGGFADAKPCRDAHGKFMKCPVVHAKRCRDKHGKFTKC